MMKALIAVVIALAVVLAITALLALPVQWLWNLGMVPAVSVTREITWGQAWALMFLVHLLFRFELTAKKSD